MEEDATFLSRLGFKHKIHTHVLFTHFPISFFTASAGFMVLHLFTNTDCFESAAYLTLVAGVVMTIPTAMTGWTTWKSKYKGARTRIFDNKIYLSIFMLALGTLLIFFRNYLIPKGEHTIWHYFFGFGFLALFFAAMMEGYYGGPLNHR
jgi:uncharacterized membrane protein